MEARTSLEQRQVASIMIPAVELQLTASSECLSCTWAGPASTAEASKASLAASELTVYFCILKLENLFCPSVVRSIHPSVLQPLIWVWVAGEVAPAKKLSHFSIQPFPPAPLWKS